MVYAFYKEFPYNHVVPLGLSYLSPENFSSNCAMLKYAPNKLLWGQTLEVWILSHGGQTTFLPPTDHYSTGHGGHRDPPHVLTQFSLGEIQKARACYQLYFLGTFFWYFSVIDTPETLRVTVTGQPTSLTLIFLLYHLTLKSVNMGRIHLPFLWTRD